MSEGHPGEAELARFGEGDKSAELEDHLRWCARCRSVVADYRWLGEEVGASLRSAAGAVEVPRPRWWAVQERLSASERRQARRLRVPAVASVVLAFSLMLALSPVVGTAVAARTLPPEAMVAPVPFTTIVSDGSVTSAVTATPAVSSEAATPLPTPGFVLPPTPPEPGV
jgi:hypothetical protein